jgi:predicted alpha-1,6-mannanase (GH76 family)
MIEEPQLEQNNQEYDLKKSTKRIGQLYPVLKAADGEILDGCHRLDSDPAWKSMVLENINTPEKKLIARLVANFHRRLVTAEEKTEWINGLAKIYMNNGLKVDGISERSPKQDLMRS